MKKQLLITLLLLQVSSVLFAQIPYATEQPAWYMTLYAEDARGTRDSVFIGYDPDARNGNANDPIYDDKNFGEVWLIPDNPNEFRMATYYWINPSDSAQKVNIRNNDFNSNLNFEILLDSATWPVKITWDLSLLRSDSLPFVPADTMLPHAQMRLGYGGFNNVWYADDLDCGQYNVLISDTVLPGQNCYTTDFLILGDFFNSPYKKSNSISLEVMPWNGKSLVDIREEENNTTSISLSPNPVDEELHISFPNTAAQPTQLLLYNTQGQLVKQEELNNLNQHTLHTNTLLPGLYFLTFTKQHSVMYSSTFIKN